MMEGMSILLLGGMLGVVITVFIIWPRGGQSGTTYRQQPYEQPRISKGYVNLGGCSSHGDCEGQQGALQSARVGQSEHRSISLPAKPWPMFGQNDTPAALPSGREEQRALPAPSVDVPWREVGRGEWDTAERPGVYVRDGGDRQTRGWH
jgi:hypothetical protein